MQSSRTVQSSSQENTHSAPQYDVSPTQAGLTSQCIDPALLQGQGYAHAGSTETFQFKYLSIGVQAVSPLAQPATAPPGATTQPTVLPQGPTRKYRCQTCTRTFDRQARLEACQNRHLGLKPYQCLGQCGHHGWYVTA